MVKDVSGSARAKCGAVFEVAIKNCIRAPQKGQKRRRVEISEQDSRALYDFYRHYVRDDREQALAQIALSSRRAAARGPAVSIGAFVIMLCLLMAFIFRTAWAPLCAAFASALVIYLFWKRRRSAQKLWAARRTFKGGAAEALEKMSLVLSGSLLKFANLPLTGGLLAAALLCAWRTISVFTGA